MKRMKLSRFAAVCMAAAFAFASERASAGPVFGKADKVAAAGDNLMALCLDGNRLYAGGGSDFFVFDVSSPLAPKLLGRVQNILGQQGVRQIAVRNGFAFVVARDSGLWIIDATNPAAPRIRSRFDTTDFATGVDVAGNVVFVGERNFGVEFVDVSDPDHPEHIISRKTPESQSVRYAGGRVYSGDWQASQVTVFDAADMKDVRQVAVADLWGFGDGVCVKGNRLYVSTGHHSVHRDPATLPYKGLEAKKVSHLQDLPREAAGCGHGLDIFDISDPAAGPVRIGRADFPPFYESSKDMWTVRVSSASDIVFCADTFNGLFAVDCSDPAKPRVVERWTFPLSARPDLPSCCIGSVAVGKGCVYVAGLGCGLVVLPAKGAAPVVRDLGDAPKNASYREPYAADAGEFHVWKPKRTGPARAVAVSGDVVYAAFGNGGLHVLREKAGGGLEKIGELAGHPSVFDVQIDGKRLYTAEGMDGFGIYELKSPTVFREIGRVEKLGKARKLARCVGVVDSTRVVFSARDGNGWLYDVSNPAAPRELLLFGPFASRGIYGIDGTICGGRFYAHCHPYKGKPLKWFDLAESPKPRSADELSYVNQRWEPGICRFDDERVLMVYSGGDWLFLSPKEGKLETSRLRRLPGKGNRGGHPRKDPGGTRVVMTRRTGREVLLYDFADEDKPVLLKKWGMTAYPNPAVFLNGKVLIPAGYQGLLLQK